MVLIPVLTPEAGLFTIMTTACVLLVMRRRLAFPALSAGQPNSELPRDQPLQRKVQKMLMEVNAESRHVFHLGAKC